LRLHYDAKHGHIGGDISCLEAMVTLHLAVMTEADRFVLSKGHAAGMLYVCLWLRGLLTEKDLATFCGEGSALPAHPSGAGIPGLLFPTGSLGHGPALSAGLALALKHQKKTGTVYCLCSDGEWQEGSNWEALAFAVHHRLNNLVILVDQNGWQGFGSTREVMGVTALAPRFKSFGASVSSLDGHDPEAILREFFISSSVPRILVLRTRKGRGLWFEDRLESHYLPLTREQYEEGLRNLTEEAT